MSCFLLSHCYHYAIVNKAINHISFISCISTLILRQHLPARRANAIKAKKHCHLEVALQETHHCDLNICHHSHMATGPKCWNSLLYSSDLYPCLKDSSGSRMQFTTILPKAIKCWLSLESPHPLNVYYLKNPLQRKDRFLIALSFHLTSIYIQWIIVILGVLAISV